MNQAPTVLIVDDNPQNAELLEAILSPDQYILKMDGSGADALASLFSQKIDLVLLDVLMPEMDGYEVTRRIRADERTQRIPIILVTGLHAVAERIKGIEAGCDDFITKPFDRHEVSARVKALLRLVHYRSQIEEKEKFESILNRINDGLLVCNADLAIVSFNQRAGELLGFSAPAPGWLAALSRDFRVAHYGELAADLARMDLDFDLERPQTETARALILSFSSSVIRDFDGAVSSVVILLHDITAKRREQHRIESFLSLLSDKLRGPLALSQGRLMALDETAGTASEPELRRSLASALGPALELLARMEKIFDFLTVNAGSGPAQMEAPRDHQGRQQVEILVRKVLDTPASKSVACSFDLPENLHLPLGGDLARILIKNLVENAVQFGDPKDPRIRVSAVQTPDSVQVTVSDNGRGIPGEELNRVFDAFYRVDAPGSTGNPGLGLGLAISKKIVENRQGSLAITSPPLGGTAVTFSLPLAGTLPPSPDKPTRSLVAR